VVVQTMGAQRKENKREINRRHLVGRVKESKVGFPSFLWRDLEEGASKVSISFATIRGRKKTLR